MSILSPLILPTQGGSNPINPQGPPGPPGPAGSDGATGPQGPAGPDVPLAMSGDVDGYTDSNQIIGIQGVPITTSGAADGDVLTYSALGDSLSLQPPSSITSLPLTGDVTGTTDGNTVSKLQGLTLLTGPTFIDGQTIVWNDNDGKLELRQLQASQVSPYTSADPLPTPANTGVMIFDTTENNPYWWNGSSWTAVPLTGDVTGQANDNEITHLQGRDLSLNNFTDGNVITWNAGANRYLLLPPPVNTLVYQPGGSASGNIYTSWTALMAARTANATIPMTIYIDDRNSPSPTGVTLDVGTWQLGGNTNLAGYLANDSGGTAPLLQLTQGVQLVDVSNLYNLTISTDASTTDTVPYIVNTAGVIPVITISGNSSINADASSNIKPLFQFSGPRALFTLEDSSVLYANGNSPAISDGGSGTLFISVFVRYLSEVVSNTISLSNGSVLAVSLDPSATFLTPNGGSVSPTFTSGNYNSNWGSSLDGYVLTKTSSNQALWQPPTAGSSALTGDVTGTTDNNTVSSIQGRTINLATLFDGGVLTYSNSTSSLTLQQPFQSTILYAAMGEPITNPNTGDIVQFDSVTGTGPGTYLSYAGSGNFTLVFTSSGPNVSYKLTASLGSLMDGSLTYQWWNVTNNAALGNVAGNVGGGPSLDAVAVIPYTYSNTTITVALKLTWVQATTFIGENTAGGFILPWATVETFGIPQDIGS